MKILGREFNSPALGQGVKNISPFGARGKKY